MGKISINLKDWETAEQALYKASRGAWDSNSDTPQLYYDYLKSITEMIENDIEAPRLIEKFKPALTRLRRIGHSNPIVQTNSCRLEIQNLLARDNKKSHQNLAYMGKTHLLRRRRPHPPGQEATLKKKLGLRR